jgi:hypothetical protein
MSYQNFQFTERLMELRVEEELRRAELSRLQREARTARPGWWFRLCRPARMLRSLRWRRDDQSLPETLVPQR